MTSLNPQDVEFALKRANDLLLNYGDKTPCYCEIGVENTHSVIVRRAGQQHKVEWRIINYDSYDAQHMQFTHGYMHIFIPKTF
jgi:hypothetical protein